MLAYPNTVVPTKGVFARLTLPDKKSVLTNVSNLDKLIVYLGCASPLGRWKGLLFNRLEECVVPFTNSVRNVLLDLRKTNTDAVLMSGSGSTVFALVETEKDAKNLVRKLQNKERTVFFTTFHRSLKDENNGNQDTWKPDTEAEIIKNINSFSTKAYIKVFVKNSRFLSKLYLIFFYFPLIYLKFFYDKKYS